MLTLADIQTARFQQASGYCTDSEAFLELVNAAVERLLSRGDWPGTLVPIRVCIRNGCVTWPRYVGQVRAMNTCGASVPMRNQWYEFMDHGRGGGYGWGYGYAESWYAGWPMRGGCINSGALFQYRAPTYNDIYGPNCYVRVYPMAQEDIGATVTIFGTDNNNQPLMTRTGDVWTEGITITVASPYGSSSVAVSRIDRVVKEITQNKLNVFAYDATNDVLFDLASYEPSETNPSYLRYRINASNWNNYGGGGGCGCSASATDCQTSIVALVKLQHLPIRVATDLVLIDNKEALLNAMRALKSEEAGNYPQSLVQWKVAVESLNRDLENASPDNQFSARSLTFGGRQVTNRMF